MTGDHASIAAGFVSVFSTAFVGGASKSTGNLVTLGLSARMLRHNLQQSGMLCHKCDERLGCASAQQYIVAVMVVNSTVKTQFHGYICHLPFNPRWVWWRFHFSELIIPVFSADIVPYSDELLHVKSGQTAATHAGTLSVRRRP